MLGKYLWPPHQAIERSQDVQDSLVAGALGVVLRQDPTPFRCRDPARQAYPR